MHGVCQLCFCNQIYAVLCCNIYLVNCFIALTIKELSLSFISLDKALFCLRKKLIIMSYLPFHLNYFFRDCDLTLLKPLWQLFTTMENNLCHDMTKPGILLPLHRALTELFFITENKANVSSPFFLYASLSSRALGMQCYAAFLAFFLEKVHQNFVCIGQIVSAFPEGVQWKSLCRDILPPYQSWNLEK